MKRTLLYMIAFMLTVTAIGQTLNVRLGSVTYQFSAEQTGEMNYANGETLTIMGKTFILADIDGMTVDNSEVKDNQECLPLPFLWLAMWLSMCLQLSVGRM